MDDTAFENYIKFEDRSGQEYFFVELVQPDILKAWKKCKPRMGWCKGVLGGVKVTDVKEEILKDLEVWDKLKNEVQKEVQSYLETKVQAVNNKMEKARRSRKQKYPNMPKEIECSKCGETVAIVPSVVAKKVEKAGILLVDYIKGFQCRVCCPVKRGKKAKDYGDVPGQLECKCGHVQKYHPSMIIRMAEAKGIPVKKLVAGYFCQKCRPSRGRKKGQKGKKGKK